MWSYYSTPASGHESNFDYQLLSLYYSSHDFDFDPTFDEYSYQFNIADDEDDDDDDEDKETLLVFFDERTGGSSSISSFFAITGTYIIFVAGFSISLLEPLLLETILSTCSKFGKSLFLFEEASVHLLLLEGLLFIFMTSFYNTPPTVALQFLELELE